MLSLTREGCRDFRGGDRSDVPSAGIATLPNRLRFFAGLTPRIAYARTCSMSRSASVAPDALAREGRLQHLSWLNKGGFHDND
jgi:hypothetical protein